MPNEAVIAESEKPRPLSLMIEVAAWQPWPLERMGW
jgi:hypothetical protein